MTVAELIEKLKTFDPGYAVLDKRDVLPPCQNCQCLYAEIVTLRFLQSGKDEMNDIFERALRRYAKGETDSEIAKKALRGEEG